MKNYLFLITLLCLFALPSNAQKIRFTDSTNRWNVVTGWGAKWPPPLYYATKDYYYDFSYIVSGQVRRRLQGGGHGSVWQSFWVWEDTTIGKVYILNPHTNAEEVLYDYNMKVGDTLKNWHGDARANVVAGIDSVLINNVWHKVFHGYNSNTAFNFRIIEGIGTDGTPIAPDFNYLGSEQLISLACFQNKGMVPVTPANSSFRIKNCADTLLSVQDLDKTNKHVEVYPQPAHSQITIKISYLITNGFICISNTLGQLVYRFDFSQKDKLDIRNTTGMKGVYYYRIADKVNGNEYSGKLLFE